MFGLESSIKHFRFSDLLECEESLYPRKFLSTGVVRCHGGKDEVCTQLKNYSFT